MSTIFKPKGPERFMHQRIGLNRLIKQRGVGALLFDPGLGKTATTIDYLSVLAYKSKEPVKVLVSCPLVAIDTWVKQMRLYVPDDIDFWAEAVGGSLVERAETLAARGGNHFQSPLKASRETYEWQHRQVHHPSALHVNRAIELDTRPEQDRRDGPVYGATRPSIIMLVVNHDTFSRRDAVGSRTMADVMLEAIKRFGPDVMVVDELHKIMSPTSNLSRLIGRAAAHIPRRIGLTGTVMPSGPMNVFGQWRFIDPFAFGTTTAEGVRKPATFGMFKWKYAQLGGWMGKEIVGYRNLDEMQTIMSDKAVVAKKEDALDLPPWSDVEIPVSLSTREAKAYADMKKDLATDLTKGVHSTATSRLTSMMRLRQITSGHLPDDDGDVHVIGRSKVNTVASLVHDTLEGEKRVVIFALFTTEIQMLKEKLEKKGTVVRVITGGTPQDERMEIRREFGSDDPRRIVLVAQIKTMSLAVNELVTANHAIFASQSQQRDDYVQARDRLNRLGQKRTMTFWHVIVPGTVDEVILRSHRDRSNLEKAMLAHIRGEPVEGLSEGLMGA